MAIDPVTATVMTTDLDHSNPEKMETKNKYSEDDLKCIKDQFDCVFKDACDKLRKEN